jgi:AcrR family transcriptional regulator
VSPRVDDDRILDARRRGGHRPRYHVATTRQIAVRAGIKEVALFRRFANKAHLVQAAIHATSPRPPRHPSRTGDLEADLLAVL